MSFSQKFLIRSVLALLVMSAWTQLAGAQELAPRVFWPAPRGTEVFAYGYLHSAGEVSTDASLPVTDAKSRINYALLSYQNTLSLFGRTSNIQFGLPYTWAKIEGVVDGQPASRELSNMADATIQLSINLLGAPSMTPAEFRVLTADPHLILGASFSVQAPTGDYDNDKLINAGANRWSYKFALGLIWPFRPDWMLEADLGARFFTDNDDFIGMTREQDPIYSIELHLVKRIKRGYWASLDMNYYEGGRTTIDGVRRNDLQENSRFGATFVMPLDSPRNSLKFSYSTGVLTSFGGDYDTYNLTYIRIW